MNDNLNYYVDLIADFQRPESTFEPTGAELATLLAEGLPEQGIEVVKVDAVDYCYWIECVAGSSQIELMVGADLLDAEHDRWYVMPCRKRSWFSRKDHPEADYRRLLLALDPVLKQCDRISEIRWFPCFETPEYLALLTPSLGPLRQADDEKQIHPLIRIDRWLDRFAGLLARPLNLLLGFLLACLMAIVLPHSGPVIITVLFFGVLFLLVVAPIIVRLRMGRESTRPSSE